MNKNNTGSVRTILIICLGFLIIYLITDWYWAILTSLVVGVLGISSNYLCNKIDYLWKKLTWLLSLIIPNILLGLVFYLFLFPISFLSKLFGSKDTLHLKNNRDSLFINNNKNYNKDTFEKIW